MVTEAIAVTSRGVCVCVCQQAPAWDSSGSPCLYSEGLSSRARHGVPEMV